MLFHSCSAGLTEAGYRRRLLFNPLWYETAAQRAAKLEQKIRPLVDDLPAIPVTAARALVLLEDPDVALADLAELVMEDATLATALLRVANSALFAGGCQAVRLDQAMIRLGLWNCKTLITTVGVRTVVRGYDATPNAGLALLTSKWSPGRREHLAAALPEMMADAAEEAASELGHI